jgi:HD-GYP domain-containing protein (c-di-GMP phosphodiesterase class II)
MPIPPSKKRGPINYQEALLEIAKSMVRLKRPRRLLKMIIRFLDKELGLSHTAIWVYEPEKAGYTIHESKGLRRLPRNLFRLERNHPLIQLFEPGGDDYQQKEFQDLRSYLSQKKIQTFLQNETLLKEKPALKVRLLLIQKALRDFRAEIAIPGHFKGSLVAILFLGEKLSRRLFTQVEIHFFQTLVHDAALAVKTSEYHERLEASRKKEQDTYYQIMMSLAQEVQAKDPYTFGHIRQVERLGVMTARRLGLDLSGKKKDVLCAGLFLHDVGKIGIPDHILKKPAPLDTEEWKVMRTHVEKGVKILEPLSDFKEAAEIVFCHHECFDGSGYPRGLKGEEIPIEARIVSAVDAFHAMVSTRCYRPGRSAEAALEELQRCAGRQFDPHVVEALGRVVREGLALDKKAGNNACLQTSG